MNSIKYSRILPFNKRLAIDSFALISTVFLTIYNQIVCPFLESRPFYEEFLNLSVIFLLMVGVREILFRTVRLDRDKPDVSRQLLKMFIFSWVTGGVLSIGLHELVYHNIDPTQILFHRPWPSDYPWHSHLKVVSGFWFLGAGLISQLELIVSEGIVRDYMIKEGMEPKEYSEYISNRITFGNFFYTFVPSVTMLIMVVRYALQDMLVNLAVAAEIAYIGFFFVAVALVSARVYGNRLRKDTGRITGVLKEIGSGDFAAHLTPARQDELGLISSGINEMSSGLEQRELLKESFRHFVAPQIADRIMEEYDTGKDLRSHGEKRNVAVLMCDIRNFSGLSETMNPSEIAEMLNEYFDHMVGAIRRHGGVVDKFIGDAVMAVFGLTSDDPEPAMNAVRAAVEIRKELRLFNGIRRKKGLCQVNNGIGLHYGEVVASFLGSSERLEFTVIGSTVNVAARLESQAKSPRPPIIFSRAVAEAIKGQVKTVRLGKEELKGVGVQELFTLYRKKKDSPGKP